MAPGPVAYGLKTFEPAAPLDSAPLPEKLRGRHGRQRLDRQMPTLDLEPEMLEKHCPPDFVERAVVLPTNALFRGHSPLRMALRPPPIGRN